VIAGVADRIQARMRHEMPGGWLKRALWLFVPIALGLPLFAHGCHTGDHDDEPQVAPPIHSAEPPR